MKALWEGEGEAFHPRARRPAFRHVFTLTAVGGTARGHMVKSLSRALLRSSSFIVLLSSPFYISSAAIANDPLEVVVTADRTDVPLKNTGSAITVITSEEIEKFGSKNIADVLRTVPGLTIAESGGLGGEAKVSLRGASPGASMVLLDGVRISDPSNTEGYFDFGNFSAANIERIEILRGPQSALYGSDAMGGVINIITKKGKRTPVREVTVEGGSYGTYGARGLMSGANDTVSYAFGVNALHSDGFPRYGYRIDRDLFSRFGSDLPVPKNDPVNMSGLNGSVLYRINQDLSVETGVSYFSNRLQIDNPDAVFSENVYNSGNRSNAELTNGYVRAKFSTFGGAFHNQFTAFGNQTNLDSYQVESYGLTKPDNSPYLYGYVGKRAGIEYQGDTQIGSIGTFIFGGRRETEYAQNYGDQTPGKFDQVTNSAFIQQRIKISSAVDLSLGGRLDAIENGPTFPTWRTAAAYRLDEFGTKLRASIGTGAKVPTLFQRFSSYGTQNLQPEKSVGFDFGIDQILGDGAVQLSATYFNNHYVNKIEYDLSDPIPGNGVDDYCSKNCYLNIGKVNSQGVELAAIAGIVPLNLDVRFSYTFTEAINRDLESDSYGKQLLRVPRHQASISFMYYGLGNWEFEPRATAVGDRRDFNGNLSAYLKLDFLTRYKVNDSNDAYIRFENLTDAHTEDVYNYGSAGRSVYVGWTSRW